MDSEGEGGHIGGSDLSGCGFYRFVFTQFTEVGFVVCARCQVGCDGACLPADQESPWRQQEEP